MRQNEFQEKFYYRRLSETGKKAYRLLLAGLYVQEKQITISDGRFTQADIMPVFEAINLDHPEIFWPDYYRVRYLISFRGCTALPSYCYEKQEKEQLVMQLNAWRRHVCSQIPAGMSQAEKIWMIYDYLARRVTYRQDETRLSNTVIGVMKKNYHSSVCEGTAKAFKLLCETAGIQCIVMTGNASPDRSKAGPHAWNMVRIGNRYRHVDATWEITHAHMKGAADYRKFLKKDCDMKCYTWDRSIVPPCC